MMKIGIVSSDVRISHCSGGMLNAIQWLSWQYETMLHQYEKQ